LALVGKPPVAPDTGHPAEFLTDADPD
jgi:hypothetical protein